MPVGSGARTVFDTAQVVVTREAEDRFHLTVWRSFLPHVRALLDIAQRELAAGLWKEQLCSTRIRPLSDDAIAAAIGRELGRQQHQIELIASENIVSRDVLIAQGSVLTNKYAEGYPGKRYYGGCEFVDEVETLAIERVKRRCSAPPTPTSSRTRAPRPTRRCSLALLQPGDRIMGMSWRTADT